jgi:hypothetical protein
MPIFVVNLHIEAVVVHAKGPTWLTRERELHVPASLGLADARDIVAYFQSARIAVDGDRADLDKPMHRLRSGVERQSEFAEERQQSRRAGTIHWPIRDA